LTFFDIFYTITVSATSGLSTEIIPDNIYSRVITVLIMVVGATFLPPQINALVALANSTTKYGTPYITQPERFHIVICGNLEIVSLRVFLKEFYNIDHGSKTMNTTVVLLNASEPSPELITLMSDSLYSHRVEYVKGSATSFKSLQKVKLLEASGAFVLAVRNSDSDPAEEDAKNVMRCVALRKFNQKLKIFAQVLLPRNKIHLEHIVTQVLCIDEFKLGMLSQNCLSPGFANMLYSLTNSVTERTLGDLPSFAGRIWKKEYLDGTLMEIYEVRLSKLYSGLLFHEAAQLIYKKHHAVLFALGYACADSQGTFGSDENIQFFPRNTVLHGLEKAYLISKDRSKADLVGKYHSMNEGTDDQSFWSEEKINNHFKEHSEMKNTRVEIVKALTQNKLGSLEVLPFAKQLQKLEESSDVVPDSSDFTVVKTRKPGVGATAVETETPTASTEDSSKSKLSLMEKVFSSKNINGKKGFVEGFNLPESVSDHVLFCSLEKTFPSNIAYFVGPFRANDANTAIVILCSASPLPTQWDVLKEYKNIYYIVGTPLLRIDLRKARVEMSKKTVCLSDPVLEQVSDRIADSFVLLSLMNIQALCEKKNFITVEFIHARNIKLIGQYDHTKYQSNVSEVSQMHAENMIPAFAGGHVFVKSMFHSILCQAYYDKNILAILKVIVINISCFCSQTLVILQGKRATFFRQPCQISLLACHMEHYFVI
jgi:hypothetical protein